MGLWSATIFELVSNGARCLSSLWMSEDVVELCCFYRTWKTSKGRIELLAHGYVQQSLNLGDNSTSLERAKASINAGAKAYVACGLGCTLRTWTQNDALPAEEKKRALACRNVYGCMHMEYVRACGRRAIAATRKLQRRSGIKIRQTAKRYQGYPNPRPQGEGMFLPKPLAFEKS